jgi:hypothetical protein
MPDTHRLHLTVPASIFAQIEALATESRVNTATMAAHILTLAIESGAHDPATGVDFGCPFSNDRIREMHWNESQSLEQIGKRAQDIEEWITAPRPGVVRRWLEAAGVNYRADRRQPTRVVPQRRAQRRPTAPDGMKVCVKCGETKPISAFYRDRHTTDGLDYSCKTCSPGGNTPDKMREYYEANKERLKTMALIRKRRAKLATTDDPAIAATVRADIAQLEEQLEAIPRATSAPEQRTTGARDINDVNDPAEIARYYGAPG